MSSFHQPSPGKAWRYSLDGATGTRTEINPVKSGLDKPDQTGFRFGPVAVDPLLQTSNGEQTARLSSNGENGDAVRFDLDAPPKKNTRESAFGYMDCPPGIIPEVFAQCQSCSEMVDDGRCLMYRPTDRVKPIGACNTYVHGTPCSASDVTDDCFAGGKPKDFGYVEGAVRCGNCSSYHQKSDHGECELYEKLNEAQPHYWGLKEHVRPTSCCNAWTGDATKRLSLGVTRLSDGKSSSDDVEVDNAPGVYLFRHGKTRLNTDGESPDLIRGWMDVPLDEQGRQQAEKLGPLGKTLDIKAVYSSDLQRAKATADAIAEDAGLSVEPTQDLRPWNLGEFQGKSAKDAAPELMHYATETPGQNVPGGESFEDYANRFLPFLMNAMDGHEKDGKNVALVTHYRNCKLAEAWVADGCGQGLDGDVFFSDDLPTGAVLRLFRQGGGWKIERVTAPGARMSIRIRFADEQEKPAAGGDVLGRAKKAVEHLESQGKGGLLGKHVQLTPEHRAALKDLHGAASKEFERQAGADPDYKEFRRLENEHRKAGSDNFMLASHRLENGGENAKVSQAGEKHMAKITVPDRVHKLIQQREHIQSLGSSLGESDRSIHGRSASTISRPARTALEFLGHEGSSSPQEKEPDQEEVTPAGVAGKSPAKPPEAPPGGVLSPKGKKVKKVADNPTHLQKKAKESPQEVEEAIRDVAKHSPAVAAAVEAVEKHGGNLPESAREAAAQARPIIEEALTTGQVPPEPPADTPPAAAGEEPEGHQPKPKSFKAPGEGGQKTLPGMAASPKQAAELKGVPKAQDEPATANVPNPAQGKLPGMEDAEEEAQGAAQAPPEGFVTGPHIWATENADHPIDVTGYAGEHNGRHYVHVAGSSSAVPMDEIWKPTGRTSPAGGADKSPEKPAQAAPEPAAEASTSPPSPIKGKSEPARTKPVEMHDEGEFVTMAHPHNPGATLSGRVVEKTPKYVRINTEYGDTVTVPNGHPAQGRDIVEPPEELHKYAEGEEVELEHPGKKGEILRGRIVGRQKVRGAKGRPAEQRILVEKDDGSVVPVPHKALAVYASKQPKQAPSPGAAGRPPQQGHLPGMEEETVGPELQKRVPGKQQNLPGMTDEVMTDDEVQQVQSELPSGFGVEDRHKDAPNHYVVTGPDKKAYIYQRGEEGKKGQFIPIDDPSKRLTKEDLEGQAKAKSPDAGKATPGGGDPEKNATQIIKESAGKADKKTKEEAEGARKKGEDWVKKTAGEKGWGHTLKVVGLILGGLYALHALRRHPGGLAIMLGLAGLYFWTKQQAEKNKDGKEAGSDEDARKDAKELAGGMAPKGDPKPDWDWESPEAGKPTAKAPRKETLPGWSPPARPGDPNKPVDTLPEVAEGEPESHPKEGVAVPADQPRPVATPASRSNQKVTNLQPKGNVTTLQEKGKTTQVDLPPGVNEGGSKIPPRRDARGRVVDVEPSPGPVARPQPGGGNTQASSSSGGDRPEDYEFPVSPEDMEDFRRYMAERKQAPTPPAQATTPPEKAPTAAPTRPKSAVQSETHPAMQWQNDFERAHGRRPNFKDTADDPYGEYRLINRHAKHGGENFRGQNSPKGDRVAKLFQQSGLSGKYSSKDVPPSGMLVTSEENWPGKGPMPESAKGWTLVFGGDELHRHGVSHAIPPEEGKGTSPPAQATTPPEKVPATAPGGKAHETLTSDGLPSQHWENEAARLGDWESLKKSFLGNKLPEDAADSMVADIRGGMTSRGAYEKWLRKWLLSVLMTKKGYSEEEARRIISHYDNGGHIDLSIKAIGPPAKRGPSG